MEAIHGGSHGKTSMALHSRALQERRRAGERATAFWRIQNRRTFALLKSRPPPASRGSAVHGVGPSWAISVLKHPGFTVYCLRGRKGLRRKVKPRGRDALAGCGQALMSLPRGDVSLQPFGKKSHQQCPR